MDPAIELTTLDLAATCSQVNGTDSLTFVQRWTLAQMLSQPVGMAGETLVYTDGRVVVRGDNQHLAGVPSYAIAVYGGTVVAVMVTNSADLTEVLRLIRVLGRAAA